MRARQSFVLTGTFDEIQSYRATKALAAAKYSSLPISVRVLPNAGDASDVTGMSPKGLSLLLPNTKNRISGNANSMLIAIASFSPGSELCGITIVDSAIIDSWVQFGWTEIEVPMHALHFEGDLVQSSFDVVKNQICSALGKLDCHLEKRDFMVGEGTTNSDIAICSALMAAASSLLWDPTAATSELQNVKKWYTLVSQLDCFAAAMLIQSESIEARSVKHGQKKL